jgi:uncharacterized circularly permuted ATP-grasp superfamily protein
VAFDEMTGFSGEVRAPYRQVAQWLSLIAPDQLERSRQEAEEFYRRAGITFAVGGDAGSEERIIPHDIIPRVITRAEWTVLARGLEQRVRALNAYLADIYGPREILRAGIVPERLVWQNPAFLPAMVGVQPSAGVYIHIAGIDVVRLGPDSFCVLEDNARTPSGVSYMLGGRALSRRLLPELFATHRVLPVEHYANELLSGLRSVAPPGAGREPTVALLTPGVYNSAYYEHSFLSDQMGIELVEGRDLFVRDETVFMRTTEGAKRVDVLYRRIDDAFLDPLAFNPDSMIGVPGLFAAYAAGNVTLANAPGTGAVDDKVIYTYVPAMIRFYLGEEPLLANVETWCCFRADDLAYVLDHLSELVVKEVHGSGGYGMLVGPHATKAEIEAFRAKLIARPDHYIAQPTLALSTCPTFGASGVAPRHVDLRPFVVSGARGMSIVPGALTRVALKEGSLVVNSSAGGGTKDTWVIG